MRIPFSYPADDTTRAVDALERAWATVMRYPVPVPADDLASVV
jgi:hypothetical protein